VYRLDGWRGVLLITACAFAATGAILSRYLSLFLSRQATLVATVLALGAMTGSLLARPHILALPLFAIWTAELVRARSEKRAPPGWLLFVMVLWANLHASFIVGIALSVALGFEAVLEDDDHWS